MCGIVGWVDRERNLQDDKSIIEDMMNTMVQRGPDDWGTYAHEGVLFGHRRLTVVDPEGGKQPMTRVLGDHEYTVIYNGELYNTDEVRELLIGKGYTFRGHSDTEVVLNAYIEWGKKCVDYFNGIFAFAVWNTYDQSLFLGRDRLGVKPLFYYLDHHRFIFASEIKAILAHPLVEPIVDEEGLMRLFGLGPARAPGDGIFKGIKEIKPGNYLYFTKDTLEINEYWKLESHPHEDSLDETIDRVRALLIDSVERQLVADVNVGTFLSGGLDSSAISSIAAAYFKRENRGTLNTFSLDYVDNDIYFRASDFQPDADAYWVDRMTNFLGSKHNRILIDTPQLVEALKDAVKFNDLPGMADVDSSLLLFGREVKKQTTVALSGECVFS